MSRKDITSESLISENYRPLHSGDDYDYSFSVKRGGTALNLSGAKIWFTVKDDPQIVPDAEAKLQLSSANISEIEITDAIHGAFVVRFTRAKTESIEGRWFYDIQIKLAGGTIITALWGEIEFLPNITRSYS